jgi:hypothetical protein
VWRRPACSGARGTQLRWLEAGLALGFLIPYVFADLLEVPRDLYYALYALFVFGACRRGRTPRTSRSAACSAGASKASKLRRNRSMSGTV